MADLKQIGDHAEVIATLLAMGGPIVFWFWRMFARIEKKLDSYLTTQGECRAELPSKFVSVQRFERHEEEIWREFNHHKHNGNGEVIRG